MLLSRAFFALVLCLVATSLAATGPATAQTARVPAPRALSDADRLTYTSAFDALRRGQLSEARDAARRLNDRVLLGQLEFERLFHPAHTATFAELSAWLDEYADLTPAPRVYALAVRRRPDGAPEPRHPGALVSLRNWASVHAAGGAAVGEEFTPPVRRDARVALNSDDLPRAWELGLATGDYWVAGLAAWRMERFDDAFSSFERVAVDPTESVWNRSEAAFWAARAANASGRVDRVQDYLRLAGRWPATFYGQIALRQLGQEIVLGGDDGGRRYLEVAATTDGGLELRPAVEPALLDAFVRDDANARRVVAFAELGRRDDARAELSLGLRRADDEDRLMWRALAHDLAPSIGVNTTSGAYIDIRQYPTPELSPEGGFTVERGLVYAIILKESGFRANARSPVGAQGLMQVMPTTAAELARDRSFVRNPRLLWNPAVNLRLGQAYVNRMLAREAFQGDILRAVASYNAGPGPMLSALRRLGPDPDPFLLIETLDVPETRAYVEQVIAAYWIYQRILGGQLNTLDALASGARLAPLHLDQAPPPASETPEAPEAPAGDSPEQPVEQAPSPPSPEEQIPETPQETPAEIATDDTHA